MAGRELVKLLVIALVIVLVMGTAFEVERHLRRLVLPIVIFMIVIIVPLTLLVDGRDIPRIMLQGGIDKTIRDPGGISSWMLRLTTAGVVAACTVRILAGLFDRRRIGLPGPALFVAFAAYAVFNYLMNLPFAQHTAPFQPAYVYPLLVFGAILMTRADGPEDLITGAKWGLFVVMAGSLAQWAVNPNFTNEPDYAGLLPGVSFRFWGIGSGPNNTGPAAMVALLLTLHQPFRLRILQWVALASAIVVLVLAQSKTAWGATLLALPALYYYRAIAKGATPPAYGYRLVLAMVMMTAAVTAVGVMLAFTQIGSRIQMWMLTDDFRQLATLTGRDTLWRVVLEEFRANPLFGYGAPIFDEDFRATTGLAYAFSAHNQFLQTLGRSGGLGLLSFTIYFAVLARYAVLAARPTRGLSVALMIALGVRGMTETPFDLQPVLAIEFAAHMVLFALALHVRAVPQQAPDAAQAAEKVKRWRRARARPKPRPAPETAAGFDDRYSHSASHHV